jgi:glycogen operon protein
MRNFLTTLLLSTGVPMLRMGDELAHTQHGNNNAYCQDNELSWLDWEPKAADPAMDFVDVVAKLIRLRRMHPVFRQRAFFEGHRLDDGVKDLAWFGPDGAEMDDRDWSSSSARTIGMYLSGRGIRTRGPRGEAIADHSFLLLLHAGAEDQAFVLPGPPWGDAYLVEIDTARPGATTQDALPAAHALAMPARSSVLLRAVDNARRDGAQPSSVHRT